MEQLELFPIEIIKKDEIPRKNNKLLKKRNKCNINKLKPLLEQLNPEIKKVPIIICNQPKTFKMIPYNWSKEKKEAYIKAHYDEKGKFIMNPAGDFEIFGGAVNRQ